MREIKFRAWDNEKLEMIYDGHCDKYSGMWGSGSTTLSLRFDGSIVGQIDDDGGKSGLWEHDAELKKGRFALMQYAGLKDKHGKEIYEGDIVRNWYFAIYEIAGFYAPIFWEDRRAGFVTWSRINPKSWEDYCLVTDELCRKLEVIGNIYENPELVK